MKTDLKLFRENLKAIRAKDSPYVRVGRIAYLNYLKICICTKSFLQDGLLIEKGCIYCYTNIDGSNVLYELTGRWDKVGHSGDFLTYNALENGIRGWNIYRKFKGNLKELNLSATHDFLYKRIEGVEK